MSRQYRLRAGVGRAAVAVTLFAGAAGSCAKDPGPPPGGDQATEVAHLQMANAVLERKLEFAGGKGFYLLLDPAASEMTLMLGAAELRRYAVLGLQVGHPRVSWIGRRANMPWQAVTWSKGELDPPRPTDRIEIKAEAPGPDGQEAKPPPIPPTAEELYRVPPRYHIRFSGGLAVDIRPREADEQAGRWTRFRAWWISKWGDVAAALGSGDHDTVRLSLVLPPKDAESLYRALPPSVGFLVLPGPPAAGAGRAGQASSTAGR